MSLATKQKEKQMIRYRWVRSDGHGIYKHTIPRNFDPITPGEGVVEMREQGVWWSCDASDDGWVTMAVQSAIQYAGTPDDEIVEQMVEYQQWAVIPINVKFEDGNCDEDDYLSEGKSDGVEYVELLRTAYGYEIYESRT